MAIKSVKAVLWRRVNKSNVDSLTGRSAGQYDIRMGKQPWIAQFFEGLPQQEPTANGGFTLPVLIQPFEGESPIPATVLNVRYMGDQ